MGNHRKPDPGQLDQRVPGATLIWPKFDEDALAAEDFDAFDDGTLPDDLTVAAYRAAREASDQAVQNRLAEVDPLPEDPNARQKLLDQILTGLRRC